MKIRDTYFKRILAWIMLVVIGVNCFGGQIRPDITNVQASEYKTSDYEKASEEVESTIRAAEEVAGIKEENTKEKIEETIEETTEEEIIYESITISDETTLTEDMEVMDLTISKPLHMNGKKLVVHGNLTLNSILYVEEGYITVDGNYQEEYSAQLVMESFNDYITIYGDYIYANAYSTSHTRRKGTFAVYGNIRGNSGASCNTIIVFDENCQVQLCGDADQIIDINTNSHFQITNLMINNTSDNGVMSKHMLNTKTIIDENNKLSYPCKGYDGMVLTKDTVIKGDFCLLEGELDLAGFQLEVQGDFIHAGGNVIVNGGTLNVNGDYKRMLTYIENESIVEDYSLGHLIMQREEDYVFIQGDYIDYGITSTKNDLTAGVMEIQGNIAAENELAWLLIETTGTHTIKLTGNGAQHIEAYNYYTGQSNRFSNLVIEKGEEGSVQWTNDLIITGSVAHYSSNITGRTRIEGASILSEVLYGNVYVYGDYTFNDDLTIYGDLYIGERYRRNIIINNCSVVVKGNYYHTDVYFAQIGETAKLRVEKNMILGHDTTSNITTGIYEIGGNFVQGGYGYIQFEGTSEVHFIGTQQQIIDLNNEFTRFDNIVVNNPKGLLVSDGPVIENVRCIQGTLSYTSGGVHGFTLEEDMVCEGDLIIAGGTLNLNGHSLHVKGDLTITGGALNMTQEEDYLLIDGDYSMLTRINHEGKLTNGILELKGDFSQTNSAYSFSASGNHRVVFSGDTVQTISVRSVTYTVFRNVEFQNKEKIVLTNGIRIEGMIIQRCPIEGWISVTDTTSFENNICEANVRVRANKSLSDDWNIKGDLVLEEYVQLSLNGNILTVNGSIWFSEHGSIYIQKGHLICNSISGENWSAVYMNYTEDQLTVHGNISLPYTYNCFQYGYMKVAGNFTFTQNACRFGSEMILELNGTQKQIITMNSEYNGFGKIILNNTSADGIYIAKDFIYTDLINLTGTKVTFSDGGSLGYTLQEDTIINDDYFLSGGVMDLNGHQLTVKGNLLQSSGTLKLNGGTLIVEGDYAIAKWSKDKEGICTYSKSSAVMEMTQDKESITVYGDLYNYSALTMTNGSLNLKQDWYVNAALTGNEVIINLSGDLQVLSAETMDFKNKCYWYLNGTKQQRFTGNISNICLNNLCIDNTKGIYLEQYPFIYGELETKGNTIDGWVYLYGTIKENSIHGSVYFNTSSGMNLEQDFYIDGDCILGKLNLNGHHLTVVGDCTGNYSGYGGVNHKNGILEIKGDFLHQNDCYYWGTGINQVILSGDTKQTIKANGLLTKFHELIIANTSKEGVYSEELIQADIITDPNQKLFFAIDGGIGYALTEDTVIQGDFTLLAGTMDLNGYQLTIMGDLIHRNGIIDLNHGILQVQGDYTLGNLDSNEKYQKHGAKLMMDEETEYVYVDGDVILSPCGNISTYLLKGTLEVKGDVSYDYHGTDQDYISRDWHLLMSGEEQQELTNLSVNDRIRLGSIDITNTSAEGIVVTKDMWFQNPVNGSEKLHGTSGYNVVWANGENPQFTIWEGDIRFDTPVTLEQDLSVEGTLAVCDPFDVNGHHLVVNTLQLQDAMQINGGIVQVKKELSHTGYYGCTAMTSDEDILQITGNLSITTGRLNLIAGQMDVKGNMNITDATVITGETHTTTLSGKMTAKGTAYIQEIHIADGITLNKLVLTKPRDYYVFNREVEGLCKELVDDIQDVTPPDTPQGVTATEVSYTKATISFNESNDDIGIAGYDIYRNDKKLISVSGTSYTDKSLQPGTKYTYYVVAKDATMNTSAASDAITITTLEDDIAPEVPGLPEVTQRMGTALRLVWNSSSDNVKTTGYRIYRDGEEIATSTKAEYLDTELLPNQYYVYQIAAYDKSGNESALTEEVRLYTQAVEISEITPSNYDELSGSKQTIKVNFANAGSTDGYQVYIGYRENLEEAYTQLFAKRVGAGTAYRKLLTAQANLDMTSIHSEAIEVIVRITDAGGYETEEVYTYYLDKSAPSKLEEVGGELKDGVAVISYAKGTEIDIEGYYIYRQTGEGERETIADITDADKTYYYDKTIESGITYTYYVAAYDEEGHIGELSDPVVLTGDEDESAPRIVSVEPVDGILYGLTNLVITASDNKALDKVLIEAYDSQDEAYYELGEYSYTQEQLVYKLDTTAYDEEVTLRITVYDTAGNCNETEYIKTYQIDNCGPDTIENFDAKIISTTAMLSWDEPSEEDFSHFVLEEKLDDDTWTEIGRTTTVTGYVLEGLLPHSTHTYRVIGYDIRGNRGEPSDERIVTIEADTIAPRIITVHPNGGHYSSILPLTVKAYDNIGIQAVTVEYSTNQENWNNITIATLEEPLKEYTLEHNFSLEEIADGDIYIRAYASDIAGNTGDTDQILIQYKVDKTAPSSVTNLAAKGEAGTIHLTWNEPIDNDIKAYRIYRSIEGLNSYKCIADSVTTLGYYDRTAAYDTSYAYQIIAVDHAGNESERSNTVVAQKLADDQAPIIYSLLPEANSWISGKSELSVYVADNDHISSVEFALKENDETATKVVVDTVVTDIANGTVRCNLDTTTFENGVYQIQVIAKDATGNVSDMYTSLCHIWNVTLDAPVLYAQAGNWCANIHYTGKEDESYALYKKRADEDDFKVVTTGVERLIYRDNDVHPNYTYIYRLVIQDKAGNISESSLSYVKPLPVDEQKPIASILTDTSVVEGYQIAFNGLESTDNDKIVSYVWDFGDGSSPVNGPTPIHSYKKAGSYYVSLTVTDPAGNTDKTSAKINVLEKNIAGKAIIEVKNQSGTPLKGVTVFVNSSSEHNDTAYTDQTGKATIMQKPGTYRVALYKPGYVATEVSVEIELHGETNYVFTITEGETMTADFEVRQLTFEEIVEAGIDISNPQNQHVFTVQTTLSFTEASRPITEEPIVMYPVKALAPGGSKAAGGGSSSSGGSGGGYVDSGESVPIEDEPDEDLYYTIHITQSISWLKDMYEATLIVYNNANSQTIVAKELSTTLSLPSGISLAGTDKGQSATQTFSDIRGGESQSVSWYLRGDAAGVYKLNASLTGKLQPFDVDIACNFESNEFEVTAGEGLVLTIQPEDRAEKNELYYVYFTLSNEGSKEFYNIKTTFGTPGTNSKRYITELHGNKKLPVIASGDMVAVNCLKPGESISGIYKTMIPVDGDQYIDYMKLVEYEYNVLSGANLGVQVRISPTASHVPVPNLIYQPNTDENSEADPVNISTGAYTDSISALSVQGVNPVSVDIQYDSTAVDGLGEFGYGWTHNYEAFIKDMNDGTVRYYVSPTGYYTFLVEDYEKLECKTDENGYLYLDMNSIPMKQNYECLNDNQAGYVLKRENNGIYTLTDNADTTLKFNKAGNLTSIQNRDGKEITITRGEDNFVVHDVTSKRSLTYILNEDKMVSSVEDASGRKAFFYYDENQCLKQFTNAIGESTYYTYDDGHRILSVTDDNGNTYVTNEYQECDSAFTSEKRAMKVIKQKDGMGNQTKFAYTVDEQSGDTITVVTTRSGKTKKTVTDAYGNVTQTVNEAGDATDMTYDTDGNEISINNANGYSVVYTYDSNGNMTTIENSLMDGTKAETTMSYDEDGNMLTMKNCDGESMSCTYYDNGLIKTVTDQNNNTITYTYNDNGQITMEKDSNDRTIEYTYDDKGDLIQTKDKNGNITSYTYNELGLQETTVIQDGSQTYSTTTYYDDMGRVDYMIDSEGGVTSYEYDQAGNITSRTDPGGSMTVYQYDNNYQLVKETVYSSEEEGKQATSTTDYTYTKEGLLKSVTDGNTGTVVTNTYDAVGNKTKEVETDKAGKKLLETHYEYDQAGNITKQTLVCLDKDATEEDNLTAQYLYYPNGKLNYSIDTAGKKTVYTYDNSWRIQSIVSGTEPTVTYTYDRAGRVQTKTVGSQSDESMTERYTYDIYGNIVTTIDPKNNVTEYRYDGNGNLTETIDSTKRVFYNKYDALNRVVETGMRYPLEPAKDIVLGKVEYNIANHTVTEIDAVNGGSITTYYDVAGRPVKTTDEEGNVLSETIYDTEGRILQTVDAKGMVTENVYNAWMQIATVRTGAKGSRSANGCYTITGEARETDYEYDALGRTTKITDANEGVSSVVFDSLGRIVSLKDPNQNAADNTTPVNTYSYEYNEQGLLSKETNAIGNVTQYQYNNELLLESMKDSANETTSYQYDSLNRISKVKDALGTITYNYDSNGNITDVIEKESGLFGVEKTIHRDFDSLNRITKYTDYKGREVGYAYDALGNMIALTYPGGEIVRYEYYADGQVKTMTSNSGGVDCTWRYSYDRYGRLHTISRPDGTTEERTYDNAGNLTSQVEKHDDEILWKNTYAYNVFGEIIKKSTASAGDTSQLETVTMTYNDANRLETYNGQKVTYDEKGNMTYGPVDGKMQELTYDCRNRLIKAGGVTYTYDAENIRISTTENGRMTEYVTDTSGSLSQLLTAYEADGTQTKYYYGAEGLSGQYNTGTKKWLFYHFDNIGSTTCVTDLTSAIVESFTYGTYGELRSTVHNGIRFLYNGAYGVITDSNGLYYMRARYYNPDIKRFINQDIKVGNIGNGQSLNRYAYCEGNPVSLIDPFGLSANGTQDQGKESKYQFWHNVLNIAGIFWDGFDLANGVLYALEGDKVNAALSFACGIPVVGSFVTGVAKAAKLTKAMSLANKVADTCKMVGKLGNTAEGVKACHDTWQEAQKMETTGGKVAYVVGTALLGYAMGKTGSWTAKKLKNLTSSSMPKFKTTLKELAGRFKNGFASSGNMKPNRGYVINPFYKGGTSSVLENANYAQKTYSNTFSPEGIKKYSDLAGEPINTIDDLVSAINNGKINVSDLPIEYIMRDGNTLILNTRTSQALTQAGIPRSQWVAIDRTGNQLFEQLLDGQLSRNKLTSEGISTVRPGGKK